MNYAYYMWLLAICLVIALIHHGVQQQKRLQPRMVIHSPTKSIWPMSHYGCTGCNWHFVVENLSEYEMIEDARADIVSIDPPLEYPPMPKPMKIKDETYDVRSFSINPKATREIDLSTGPSEDPNSQREFFIVYAVKEALRPIPIRRYRVSVRISAKNTPPARAVFEVWVDGMAGVKCVQL